MYKENIPWYDVYRRPACRDNKEKSYLCLTPREIKAELERHVRGQDETCRQVAIMMYQHLHGHRSVNLVAGPTGSGKTYIAETLKRLFPDVVYIRDISNVTCDGWKGNKKVSSLFQGIQISYCNNKKIYPFLILDECDKMFSPKLATGGEMVNESVQAEFLSVIHGGEVPVNQEDGTTEAMHTGHMSFLFAGAFEKRAGVIAEKASGSSIGFGASQEKIRSYSRALTIEDVRQAGCIRELCGRIQKVISLNPLEESHFREMLEKKDSGPLFDLEKEFNIRFYLSNEKKDELAHNSYASGLGVRGLKNQLRDYIDEAVWDDCHTRSIEII